MEGTFLATAAFGLEGIVAEELRHIGIPAKAEQGGARFSGDAALAMRSDLRLRCADRVLMILCEREARTFEALFQAVGGIAWEKLLRRDASVLVTGKCVRSQLMSVRDCQSVAKKAIVSRLQQIWHVERLPETGAPFHVDVSLRNDLLRVTLDMSGEALNRRGYRTWNGEAPLRETLAAALVRLSSWNTGMPLYDPCCGTGTLLIEAAMLGTDRAPGLRRAFGCEAFPFLSSADVEQERAQIEALYKPDAPLWISGSDIDSNALMLCQKHIAQAGFEGRVCATRVDLRDVRRPEEHGVFLCNPPYGERMSDRDSCRDLYRELGLLLRRHPGWRMGVIAADPAFERSFGCRAVKKRRLYNGRLECEFFMFNA